MLALSKCLLSSDRLGTPTTLLAACSGASVLTVEEGVLVPCPTLPWCSSVLFLRPAIGCWGAEASSSPALPSQELPQASVRSRHLLSPSQPIRSLRAGCRSRARPSLCHGLSIPCRFAPCRLPGCARAPGRSHTSCRAFCPVSDGGSPAASCTAAAPSFGVPRQQ